MLASWGFANELGSFGLLYVAYSPVYYGNYLVILCTIALPIMSFAALLFFKEDHIHFLAVAAVVSVFFAKGSGSPASGLYPWLLREFFLFRFFADPSFIMPIGRHVNFCSWNHHYSEKTSLRVEPIF